MTNYRRSAVSTTALAVCVSVSWQGGDAAAQDLPPRTPTLVAAAAPQHEAPSAPFEYRYVGRMEVEGRPTVHLTKDEKLYPVKVGDVLDGQFRVEGIKSDGLELTYLPRKRRQFVAFSTITAPNATQSSVATRPEASPRQSVTTTVPMQSDGAGAPSSAPGTLPHAPIAGAGGGDGGAPPPPIGVPPAAAAPDAAQGVTTAQPPAGTSMPMSRPTTEMPVEPPTVSQMPTFPPGTELPPSGATMATTPP
jgi:hypothetical protein